MTKLREQNGQIKGFIYFHPKNHNILICICIFTYMCVCVKEGERECVCVKERDRVCVCV